LIKVELVPEIICALKCVDELFLIFDMDFVDFEAVEGRDSEGVFTGFHDYVVKR
jgi:hypothetical protein